VSDVIRDAVILLAAELDAMILDEAMKPLGRFYPQLTSEYVIWMMNGALW